MVGGREQHRGVRHGHGAGGERRPCDMRRRRLTEPGLAGLASAQTTRTSFASTSAPVALARWNRIVSPGRTDRRSAYPVSGSMVIGSWAIGSWVPASVQAGVAAFAESTMDFPHNNPTRYSRNQTPVDGKIIVVLSKDFTSKRLEVCAVEKMRQ